MGEPVPTQDLILLEAKGKMIHVNCPRAEDEWAEN